MASGDNQKLMDAAEALERLAVSEESKGYKRSPVTARKTAASLKKLSRWA